MTDQGHAFARLNGQYVGKTVADGREDNQRHPLKGHFAWHRFSGDAPGSFDGLSQHATKLFGAANRPMHLHKQIGARGDGIANDDRQQQKPGQFTLTDSSFEITNCVPYQSTKTCA